MIKRGGCEPNRFGYAPDPRSSVVASRAGRASVATARSHRRRPGHAPGRSATFLTLGSHGPVMADCAEDGCQREAAVLLRIPWTENRAVCTGHARVLARQDGVVADPLEGADWP